MLPFIGLAVVLTLPAYRKFSVKEKETSKNIRKEGYAVVLTIGTGLLMMGLGSITDWKGMALSVVGCFHDSTFAKVAAWRYF